ncbi:cation transporter [Rickettsiales endosymbiont of Peranema trichophorum]|uniref:cation diffusion facilitator family transporter n=1 Tax=Rickettsiales endosymbiont of Peranema trichophorum TaxID=2486577 RepID=UPI001022C588|nr:cation diffusion facilitator family transporter [Rickettsiales endosymbiont of Peranema trichophorum]RZI47660.1 cation transporter [Rickettsiales endosymbiont of Peranema trichophorum]
MYEYDRGEKALMISLVIKFVLTLAEIIAGILCGSIALLADALHNLSDTISLLITLIAQIIGKRPPDFDKTFGYKRIEVVAALINFTSMVMIGIYLMLESLERYLHPQDIDGMIVIIVAVFAVFINGITAHILYSFSGKNLNFRAAFLHNFTDAISSIGVIIVGVLILLYQFYIADILITLVISIYITCQGLSGLSKAVNILVNASPEGLDVKALIKSIEALDDAIINVHHVHIWRIDEYKNALEAHVVVGEFEKMEMVKTKIKQHIKQYNVEHSTLEFEKFDGMFEEDKCYN